MDFNNSSFRSHATSQIIILTIGFGHIFVLLQFLHDRQGLLQSLIFIMYQLIHTFPMVFNFFMLALANVIFRRLQNPERAIDNIMRSDALMLKKCRCA